MQQSSTTTKPKAYSYLRFSTPEQQKGDSFRRQATMATDYAARKGLDLDASLTFHDLGVSAFKGANAETGRLADFREAVDAGLVPQGSFLLVEALDRISRLAPRKALRVLEDIVGSGVAVVTLNDEKVYTAENLDSDPVGLILAIMLFMRANEESATKARRLKAAWDGKRLAASTKPLTAKVPAWIELEKTATGSHLVLIPNRAAIVRRVFAETLAGFGQHAIAQGLITDGVPCFGTASHWQRTYISKILHNSATYGVFTPHEYRHEGSKRTRVPLPEVASYYPAVISVDTFLEAQRGDGTAHTTKARKGQTVNFFGGLATCPICASTMTRVNKGSGPKGGKPKLVCVKAKAGAGCNYRAVDLATVEAGFMANLGSFIGNAPSGVEGLDDELATMDNVIGVCQDEGDNLVQALAEGPSLAITKKLREIERGLAEVQAARVVVLDKIASGSSPVLAQRLRDLEDVLGAEPLNRPKANLLMRSVLTSMVVDYPNGQLVFEWKHGGESSLQYAWPDEKSHAAQTA